MNFRKNLSEEVEVNLTPLIDVVFLLLIFFMVTTTFDKNAKVNINLPTTDNVTPLPAGVSKNEMELIVDKDGNYFIDGNEVINKQDETLFRAMTQALSERGDKELPSLLISSDAETSYQKVITAMDIAGRLGLVNIRMSTAQNNK